MLLFLFVFLAFVFLVLTIYVLVFVVLFVVLILFAPSSSSSSPNLRGFGARMTSSPRGASILSQYAAHCSGRRPPAGALLPPPYASIRRPYTTS